MKKSSKNYNLGFTLLETLVAISILLVGISAAFSAAQSGLSSTIAIKDKTTALFLAQEAMEMVHNLKDQNLLEQNRNGNPSIPDLFSGIPPCTGGGICNFDFDYDLSDASSVRFISCEDTATPGVEDCSPLNIATGDDDREIYTHDVGGIASKFIRNITLTPSHIQSPNSDDVIVSVTVKWSNNPKDKFVIYDDLFNWFAP